MPILHTQAAGDNKCAQTGYGRYRFLTSEKVISRVIMKNYLLKFQLFILLFSSIQMIHAADTSDGADSSMSYLNRNVYEPVRINEKKLNHGQGLRNIILFIGDGMGVAEVFAGMTANHGKLNLEYLKYTGFSRTQASGNYITDSAAGATAIACGVKTYNGAIGVNADTVKVPNILELAEARGLSTGLIATSSITHATPAAFIAHEKSREMYESIARDFLDTDVDVVIGGGWGHFADRMDGRSLIPVLRQRGYTTIADENELTLSNGPKLFALLAEGHLPVAVERKDLLSRAALAALNRLNQNEKGFFLMIEGSQIDWGGHKNDTGRVIEEFLDFDRTIGTALKFAEGNGQTLILCTADHETGGMALESGDIAAGRVDADYTTTGHTGVMVPVFAIGPGADRFIGIYENTALFHKMKALLKL